jgi:hypothetical protein
MILNKGNLDIITKEKLQGWSQKKKAKRGWTMTIAILRFTKNQNIY